MKRFQSLNKRLDIDPTPFDIVIMILLVMAILGSMGCTSSTLCRTVCLPDSECRQVCKQKVDWD